MSPCHYACTLCNFLQIKKRQLADLNQVREDLDDLCYHEPMGTETNDREGTRVVDQHQSLSPLPLYL